MKLQYKILLIGSLVANFADNLIGPFYAVFVKKIGGDILSLGYSIALYSIVAGILVIIFGKYSDKLQKEKFIIIGYFLGLIATLGYIVIKSPWQLFVLQIIFALSGAFLLAPMQSLFAKYINTKSAGIEWALEGGGAKIIVGCAVLLGTYIVNSFGFLALFITMSLLQAAAVILSFILYQKTKTT